MLSFHIIHCQKFLFHLLLRCSLVFFVICSLRHKLNPRSPHQCIHRSGVSTRKTRPRVKKPGLDPTNPASYIVLFQACSSFRNLLNVSFTNNYLTMWNHCICFHLCNLAFVDITPRKQQSSKCTTTLSGPLTLGSLQLCCCWTSLLLVERVIHKH